MVKEKQLDRRWWSLCVLSSAGFQKAMPRGQGMDQRLPESQDPESESHGVIKKTTVYRGGLSFSALTLSSENHSLSLGRYVAVITFLEPQKSQVRKYVNPLCRNAFQMQNSVYQGSMRSQ